MENLIDDITAEDLRKISYERGKRVNISSILNRCMAEADIGLYHVFWNFPLTPSEIERLDEKGFKVEDLSSQVDTSYKISWE